MGAWNPSPKIVTFVPPSIGPLSGLSVVIFGVSTSAWKVKLPVAVTRVSFGLPTLLSRTIVAVFCCPTPRFTAGVRTWICVAFTDTGNASTGVVPAPKSKSTFTGATKFVPVIVTSSPPCGRPNCGVNPVIVGAVFGGGGVTGLSWKVMFVVFVTLFTVAVTIAVPAVDDVNGTVATPFVVVRIVFGPLTSVNVPRLFVVLNSTAVPFGAGLLPIVTVAVIVTVESTGGFAF